MPRSKKINFPQSCSLTVGKASTIGIVKDTKKDGSLYENKHGNKMLYVRLNAICIGGKFYTFNGLLTEVK